MLLIHGHRFALGAAGDDCPDGHIFARDPPLHDRKAINAPAPFRSIAR